MDCKKLNILFVCGSMEPGRDGVGDYTRLLAAELTRRGHHVSIIALRDKFIYNSFISKQEQSGVSIEVLRCTIKDNLKTRGAAALKYAESFKPDWVSLQFVPYAFATNGVPMGLGAVISSLSHGSKFHMMIHESYLTGKLNIKNRLVRVGQILGLQNIVKDLKPSIIHTSIPSYQKLLKDIGLESQKLGLYGNLPIVNGHRVARNDQIMKAVYFGIGPVEKEFSKFSKGIIEFIGRTNRKIELTFCGNLSEIGEQFVTFLESQNIEGLEIQVLGRMESEELSKLFFESDFGVARVEPDLLGKSGSAIAMLEHGLPLWVPLAIDKAQIENEFDFRTDLCFDQINEDIERAEPISRLVQVTDKLETSFIEIHSKIQNLSHS